ncbi:MAG: SirB2 family protein [Hydrogenophaga sp.]|uniref:SirB2 family protein n=1 Tax=Hydrogenophaga sp. TaxID=1904254 RepID=UPI002717F91B|nr:SirB2 family protein [Hydrogenophaga sp.]MDO9147124.1 SirB2 family protein [Hydrogenophaga sp.]MDO9605930.1 SirB2 family protein [Hydrogenophaga sp.]
MQASLFGTLYPGLLHAHIGLVTLSAGLFFLRWLGVLAGLRWPMQRLSRRLSVVIDTALLSAGIALWWLLQLHPLHQLWLGTKLGLLVVYIGLGTFALKRGRTRGHKFAFGLLALTVLAFMASVALARHPLGWWRL